MNYGDDHNGGLRGDLRASYRDLEGAAPDQADKDLAIVRQALEIKADSARWAAAVARHKENARAVEKGDTDG